MSINLKEIVVKPRWKTILINLLYEGKIDPWNIDIDLVIEEFLNEIKKLKELELHIPGNLILATSILLKYKSLYLFPPEQEEQEENIIIETEKIEISKRMAPKRPITFNELVEIIEKSLEFNIKEVKRKERRQANIAVLTPIKEENLEERIERIVNLLVEKMDEYGIVRLEEVMVEKELEENVANFLVILHMENERFLRIEQEEAFGEVLLYLEKDKVLRNG